MLVFDFPPEAENETGCFSVLDRSKSEELLFIPSGASLSALPAFDGWTFFLPPTPKLSSLPIPEKTLLPEPGVLSGNPVWISSRLCGGTLEYRLSEALTRYGSRLWFVIEPFRTLLPLPCPDSHGEEVDITPECLLDADAFCCKYSVEFSDPPKLFLLDTAETVRRKIELAEKVGVERVIVLSKNVEKSILQDF